MKKGWKSKAMLLVLLLCIGAFAGSSAVYAKNVQPSKAAVSTTSKTPGWKKIGGYWYYYNYKEKRLQCGWLTLGGVRYYCRENGRMVTGWQTIGGKRYYFTSSGAMQKNCWRQTSNKKWYFLGADGALYKNKWLNWKGQKYFLSANGSMVTGWNTINKKRYHFSSSGAMTRNNWVKTAGGNWYFLQSNGVLLKSDWLKWKGKWYYLSSNGSMVTGWKNIGGKKYYFYSPNGDMAASTWIGNYYVGADGAMTPTSWSSGDGTRKVYSSPTLNVEVKKYYQYSTNYWVARIKTSSAKQLKSALSYGTYGGKRQKTSEAVQMNGGIIGVNGSAFSYADGKPSPLGMCIKNGKVYGNYNTSYTVFCVKNDGTMFTAPQGLWAQSLLNMGVKDTYNFGPVLLSGGVPQPAIAETLKYYPRTVAAMIKPNDYVLLVCDGNGVGGSRGLNHSQLVAILQSYGCKYAYNLDGGGSATMYYNGQVLNNPSDGAERPCADFLYFTK